MGKKVGIRREDKSKWERRVPLTPSHVRDLVGSGYGVVVQPSPIRAFPDEEYREAGATIAEDLSGCDVVFAVKEIPAGMFRSKGAYVFFAHVIKGQPHNMPMLRRLLDLGCTLIDYEKVVNDKGQRLIFFGRYAGLAGMMDTLWALGQRLKSEGMQTPFASLQPTHTYGDLDRVKAAVSSAGERIATDGLPRSIAPMIFGFAGYGNVAQGAQEIFDLLPHREVSPEHLEDLVSLKDSQTLFKVVFKEEHMVKPRDPDRPFALQEYYDHPERYVGDFERYVPSLSVLVNCIYWAPQYPRLITREFLRNLYGQDAPPKLRVIGDISCDVEGAVECTLKCTQPDDPVFVYRARSDDLVMGVEGDGPVVLAVDNLPCELPRESSQAFGDGLLPLVGGIMQSDLDRPFEQLQLHPSIKAAVIAHGGRLTPNYAYLQEKLGEGGAT